MWKPVPENHPSELRNDYHTIHDYMIPLKNHPAHRFLLFLPVLIILCSWSGSSFAQQQEQCAFTLREAQNLYSQGLIENIPGMLQACIRDGFTKEERSEAYKLIILSYLYDDDQEKANQEMLLFLKRYPEYEISATDPVEFTYLFNSYDTRPKLTFGAFFGGNMSHGSVAEPFSVENLNTAQDPVLKFSTLGISGGVRFNFLLARNLELCTEAMFSTNTFSFEPGTLYDMNVLVHNETQSRIELPLTVTYEAELGSWRPYARAGLMGGYLISSSVNLTRTYTGDGQLNDVEVLNSDYKLLRRTVNLWAVAGGGVKYKIPKGYIILDLRYNVGLMLQNDHSQNRYTAADQVQDGIFMGYYTDPDFSLNNVVLSIGYLRSLYKPKKKL
jgi:hypothetical protein